MLLKKYVCVTSSNIIVSKSVHFYTNNSSFFSSFWRSSTPLCVTNTFSLFIYLLIDTQAICRFSYYELYFYNHGYVYISVILSFLVFDHFWSLGVRIFCLMFLSRALPDVLMVITELQILGKNRRRCYYHMKADTKHGRVLAILALTFGSGSVALVSLVERLYFSFHTLIFP